MYEKLKQFGNGDRIFNPVVKSVGHEDSYYPVHKYPMFLFQLIANKNGKQCYFDFDTEEVYMK